MTNETLYRCEARDASDNPALAEEFLAAMGYDYSTEYDSETRISRHFLYFEDEDAAKLAENLLNDLPEDWCALGLTFVETAVASIEKKDWSEVWKKFFTVQHVSERVVIKPTWLDYAPADGEVVVELDPGMSFGTGKHATTRFCLREIANLADFKLRENSDLRLLDAGCGSGILTIAAMKLGFRRGAAFDQDAHSIICAGENIELNGLDVSAVDLSEMDILRASETFEPFDIVVANMLSHILLENRSFIAKLVKPGGTLVAAGILTKEYREFREAFENEGFREIRAAEEDEWTGGVFQSAV
ncbi:MAG: 50S ribosomal protein L11 methyltransferase [Victivallales bacterium]|nr:50S ribosomal protein L11 methyltransferase [Victivallales bacterium]